MAQEKTSKKSIDDLNRIYQEADSVDREFFAEQRSHVLLVEGTHYSRRGYRDRPNLRDSRDLSYDNQKLRITKNHMHRVQRTYVGNILAHAPDVTILPNDETSLQDKKAAELNLAVKNYLGYKHRLKEKTRKWCNSFVGGEVAVKIFWDPNAGELKGYEQATDEMGNPLFGEDGNPIPDETRPVFRGAFVFEDIFAANLLRHASSKDMRLSECWINRKMVETSKLKEMYKDDPDISKMIHDSEDETYVVFDSTKATYTQIKNQTMVREFYYRPCMEYPKGYYFFAIAEGIIEEGPLPEGIFPIVWQGFDLYETTPRGRGIGKVARPFQAEINRASSSQAMHQVTVGDDKILYQAGTKLAPGAVLPGVRGITFQGMPPTILEGRTGAQYADYILGTESEMNRALMIDELSQEKASNMDPMALLFRSIGQKLKYAEYGEKFEQFLVDVWETVLRLSKYYLPEDEMIAAVGKSEFINIQEFKNTLPLNYQIKIVPQEDTLETQMGKQIVFQHALQYVGTQLTPDQIGMILKDLPFGNMKDATLGLTIDYDILTNDMLLIERGQMPELTPGVKPEVALKRVDLRIKQPDFRLLDPQIQQIYQQYRQAWLDIQAQQAQALIDAKNEFIPANGAMIACDMYIPDPEDPQKAAKRVRVPYQALDWLVKKLEAQGMGLQTLENLNSATMADLAMQLQQQSPQAMGQPQMGAMQ